MTRALRCPPHGNRRVCAPLTVGVAVVGERVGMAVVGMAGVGVAAQAQPGVKGVAKLVRQYRAGRAHCPAAVWRLTARPLYSEPAAQRCPEEHM
jgi:hypothetical protein